MVLVWRNLLALVRHVRPHLKVALLVALLDTRYGPRLAVLHDFATTNWSARE